MHEDDGAAEPAAERQEREADQREHERPRVDRAVLVAAVADEGGDQEEDGRGQHRAHVPGRRPPERRAPVDRRASRRSRSGRSGPVMIRPIDERQPPGVRCRTFAIPTTLGEGGDRRGRVGADRRVGQRRVKRVAGQTVPEVAELHRRRILRNGARSGFSSLLLGGVEEAEERRVLGEVRLDLARSHRSSQQSRASLAELVLDPMKAAIVHG